MPNEIIISEVRETLTAYLNPNQSTRMFLRAYSGRPGCGCGCRGNYTNKPAAIRRVVAGALDAIENEPSVRVDTISGDGVAVETDGRYRWFYYEEE